jgi:hypothetical protein
MCRDIHAKFDKNWFRYSRVNEGGFTGADVAEIAEICLREINQKESCSAQTA